MRKKRTLPKALLGTAIPFYTFSESFREDRLDLKLSTAYYQPNFNSILRKDCRQAPASGGMILINCYRFVIPLVGKI